MKNISRSLLATKTARRNKPSNTLLSVIFAPLILQASSIAMAESNAVADLSKQLPDLINMIQERQQHLKRALNRDNTNYQTYDNEKDHVPSYNTSTPSQTSTPDNNLLDQVSKNAFSNGLRDPFTVTPKIAKLNNSYNNGDVDASFITSSAIDQVPKLKLRGVIMHDQDSSPLALLDIAGDGVHMVRVGDRISFNAANPLQVLEIKQINRLNVIVEIGTLGDLVVVR